MSTSAFLIGSLTILGIICVRKYAKTPSMLLVDPVMMARAPVLGVSMGSSNRENKSSMFKSYSVAQGLTKRLIT